MSDQLNGSGAANPNAGGDVAPALTEERVSQIVAQTVNAAVSSHLKRSLPKEIEGAMSGFKESFAGLLNENLGPIRQSFEARQKQEQEEREKANQQAAKPGAGQPNPELEALKKAMAEQQATQDKRLQAYEAKLKEADLRAETERRKAVEATGLTSLRGALSGVLHPDAVEAASDLLRARKQVEINDDGSLKMRIRAALSKGMPEEDHELSLSEALPHWLKTKEAAFFLPPPTQGGAGGAGGRPPGGSPNGGATPKPEHGNPSDAFERKFGKSLDQLI